MAFIPTRSVNFPRIAESDVAVVLRGFPPNAIISVAHADTQQQFPRDGVRFLCPEEEGKAISLSGGPNVVYVDTNGSAGVEKLHITVPYWVTVYYAIEVNSIDPRLIGHISNHGNVAVEPGEVWVHLAQGAALRHLGSAVFFPEHLAKAIETALSEFTNSDSTLGRDFHRLVLQKRPAFAEARQKATAGRGQQPEIRAVTLQRTQDPVGQHPALFRMYPVFGLLVPNYALGTPQAKVKEAAQAFAAELRKQREGASPKAPAWARQGPQGPRGPQPHQTRRRASPGADLRG